MGQNLVNEAEVLTGEKKFKLGKLQNSPFIKVNTCWDSLVARWSITRLPMQETREMQVRFLGQEDLLEKEMVLHSSILAWRIPWTEEPGVLQSMGLQSQTRLTDHHHLQLNAGGGGQYHTTVLPSHYVTKTQEGYVAAQILLHFSMGWSSLIIFLLKFLHQLALNYINAPQFISSSVTLLYFLFVLSGALWNKNA